MGGTSNQQYFNTRQAATFIGMKPQTLREWRCAGNGPTYFRLGSPLKGRCLYKLTDLEEWLALRAYASTAAETVAAQGS